MPNFQSLKIALLISVVPTLVVYLISGSLIISSIVPIVLIYYFYKYAEYHKDRKEPLKILLGDDQLHFMLSDDNFLDIPLQKGQSIAEVITTTVKKEMSTISRFVDRIYLVNIKDDTLQNQLNSMIVK